MAGSLNRAMLIGRLGSDPVVRHSQDGKPIVTLSVATSETWRDKSSGERKEKTEWHRVVIFNEGLAKVAEQYLKKGALVHIEGQLQTRKWQKDGIDTYSTEIVLQAFNGMMNMLGGKSDAGDNDDRAGDDRGEGGRSSAPRTSKPASRSFARDLDDEVPF